MVRMVLRNVGIVEEADKAATIQEWTEGRTTHISELTHQEVNRLVTSYQGENGRSKMIGKILSLAHEMGWHSPSGLRPPPQGEDNSKPKVDMERVNAWCRKYSPEHKDLDKIPTHQLGKVVTIFQKVYMDFLKGL